MRIHLTSSAPAEGCSMSALVRKRNLSLFNTLQKIIKQFACIDHSKWRLLVQILFLFVCNVANNWIYTPLWVGAGEQLPHLLILLILGDFRWIKTLITWTLTSRLAVSGTECHTFAGCCSAKRQLCISVLVNKKPLGGNQAVSKRKCVGPQYKTRYQIFSSTGWANNVWSEWNCCS